MKRSSPFLALLLALLLLFGLSSFAFAQDGAEEPDPAMPVITLQPQDVREGLGKVLVLKAQASIPNGDRVAYQWYRVVDGVPYAMEQEGDGRETSIYMVYPGTGYYYVEVYNSSHPSLRVASDTVTVTAYIPWYFWLVPIAFLIAPLKLLLSW